MKQSLRRIGVSLLVAGVFAISIVTAYDLARYCGGGEDSCMVAAVSFGVPGYELAYDSSITTAQTTVSESSAYPSLLQSVFMFIKIVGIYLVFLGVITLVVLEILELHYIRILLKKKRA